MDLPRFDPATEERSFKLGINAQLEVLLLPALMAHIGSHAPGLQILSRAVTRQRVFGMLDEGEIDLAVGFLPGGATWHRRERLYQEEHVCCFDPRQPPFARPLSADDYRASAHGLVSATDSPTGYLEQALTRAGARPRVALASHNFMTLCAAASSRPMIVMLASRVAAAYAARFGLVTSPIPFEIGTVDIDMIWHARNDRDPAMTWLRERIRATV